MSDKPKIVCVGHVCIDRNTTEYAHYTGWGGILHLASYFQEQGLHSPVITSHGSDLAEHAKEFELLPKMPNVERTLGFENIIRPGELRVQYCHHVDMSLPPALAPELKMVIAEADIVIVAAFLPTYSAEWLEEALGFAKPDSLKVLCPQGYLRSVGPDGLVSPRTFEEAQHVVPLFDLTFISDEDTPHAVRVAQDWKRFAPNTEIIVTNGPEGATIIGVDDVKNIPTTPIAREQIIDSVGAGDVFAAAVSLAYSGGASLEDAVLAGHQAAGRKLTTRRDTVVPSGSSR